MRLVVALGGHAIARRGRPVTIADQRAAVARACAPIAELARQHQVAVTHGNGPQIGQLALQALAADPVGDSTLDVLGAESDGLIGYLVEQEIGNCLPPDHRTVTVLTRTVVDGDDPAFEHPTKPVGRRYDAAQAAELARAHGWTVQPFDGGHRRVVASPAPLRILHAEPLDWLLDKGAVVVCAGGGGIPVALQPGTGRVVGVDAVVDKDLASAVLAEALHADLLVIATDVPAVVAGWGTERAREIASAGPDDLRPEDFESGTMAPKVEAAVRFARTGLGRAVIGSLDDLQAVVAGRAGTTVDAGTAGVRYREPRGRA